MFGSVESRTYIAGMSMVRIYNTDTVAEIAFKIYYDFDVLTSCTIFGFVIGENDVFEKGRLVLDEIEKLYKGECLDDRGNRKYKMKKDSIGGPLAHKIFTWERRIVDKEPRYTIWRYQ